MTDRELLELAAKAAGIRLIAWTRFYDEWKFACEPTGEPWNPVIDDGDALRLAVKLNLQVTPGTYLEHEATAYRAGIAEANESVHYQQDLAAATRRAIVRAAAEIGKQGGDKP
jgi:hypothetical protein